MAVVDLLNAGPQCDLVEIHLDRFKNTPDVRDLIAAKRNPAIFTCRRERDGGLWSGSEDERLTLLRQAVVDGANYIDIELDVATEIRKFPGCKRIISISDLDETPSDLATRYARAVQQAPDFIRLTTRVDSLEAAMPLLKLLVRAKVPTVVHAVGKASVMVNLMARKLGAPWTYAALERGMEVYPDQSSVHELDNVYHVRRIGPRTPLFGIAGLSEREYGMIAGLNAGLAWHGSEARCWPFHVQDADSLPAIARQFKLTGVLTGAAHADAARKAADVLDPQVKETGIVDLLLPQDGGLRGTSTLGPATVEELLATLHEQFASRRPLDGRTVMLVGAGALPRLMARAVQRHGAIPIFTSRDSDEAREAARFAGCRHVPYEALYSTLHDVLIVCENSNSDKVPRNRVARTGPVHPGYLRPGMVVADLTEFPRRTDLLAGAADRGCLVVEPHRILSREAGIVLWELCGQEMDFETLESLLTNLATAGAA